MVNLITPKYRSHLLWSYYLRLTTVLCITLGAVLSIVAIFLLPTYLIVHAEAAQAEEYVKTANAMAEQRAKGQSQEVLATFHESVSLLNRAARPPAFAHVLEVVTTDLPRGVSLTSIKTEFGVDGAVRVTLQGTARTRAELIAYSNTLKKHPELTQVLVPVSDLVADVDSTFTVTGTWMSPTKK